MNAAYQLSYEIPYEILDQYTPVQMMLLMILLLTFIAMFLGMLMLTISLYGNQRFAVAAAVLMVLLLFFVLNTYPDMRMGYAKLIPTVWAQITKCNTTMGGYYWLPDIKYMLCFLTVGILIEIFLCIHRAALVDFHWVNEDA